MNRRRYAVCTEEIMLKKAMCESLIALLPKSHACPYPYEPIQLGTDEMEASQRREGGRIRFVATRRIQP